MLLSFGNLRFFVFFRFVILGATTPPNARINLFVLVILWLCCRSERQHWLILLESSVLLDFIFFSKRDKK